MDVLGRHAEPDTRELAPVAPEPVAPEPIDGEPVAPEPVAPEPVDGDLAVGLSDDPFADDLDEQLAARAPQRWATRTTLVLAGLVLLVGGFLAGAQVQKHFGPAPAAVTGRGQPGGAGLTAGQR